MALASWKQWRHWLPSLLLFVVYCPSNLFMPLLVLDLLEHLGELSKPGIVLGALSSWVIVNAALLLTIFGARRVKPPILWGLRVLLLVYALPHILLVSVLAPMSMPGAWIP